MDPYSTQLLMMNQIRQISGTFIEHIRSILFALLLIILGLIVSEIIKYLSGILLRLIRWDRFCLWIGLGQIFKKVRPDLTSTRITSEMLFWFTMLSFFMKSLMITDISWCIWLSRAYFDFLPTAFSAAVVIIITLTLSHWLAQMVFIVVENSIAVLASAIIRTIVLALGLNICLLKFGIEANLAYAVVLILFAGIVLAISLSWALNRGQTWREVIRVSEGEENV